MTNRLRRSISRFVISFLIVTLGLVPANVPFAGVFSASAAADAAESDGYAAYSAEVNGTQIVNLKVEYRTNPIGIDTTPRFSWNMVSNLRGQKQTAYQLLVASSPDKLTPEEADIWNSGIVNSGSSVAVKYAGPPLEPTTRYYWTVKVWDKDGNELPMPEANWFETGLLSTNGIDGWDGAKWISVDTEEVGGAPFLRKEAPLNGEVESVRLYISALGVYVAFINGQRVGVVSDEGIAYELLTPGWTMYNKEINYMSYDVTNYVKGHDRVTIGAILGNGWYRGRISNRAPYYDPQNDLALFAKLLIRYADGTTESIVTDLDWKGTIHTPYVMNDIYDGEEYDATKEIEGWNENGFDDSGWYPVKEHNYRTLYPDVKVTSYNGRTAQIVDRWDQRPIAVTTYNGIINVESSKNGRGEINIDPSRTITDPQAARDYDVTISSGDTVIFDLGQNMVGVPRITVKGEAGTKIRLRFAEMLNDDSPGADGPKGSIYQANLRSAKASAYYTLKGDEQGETYQTALSFFGFRYVEVTVLSEGKSVEILDVTGKVVTSAINVTGSVVTSIMDYEN